MAKPPEPVPSRRWYDDACGTAHALELLGERWALLIVRELVFGPRRFVDLRAGLPGISAPVLTERLKGLEASGIVRRYVLAPPANVQVYELTPWGYEAEPILQTTGRWAARSPSHDPTLPLSAASIMESFKTMLSVERAAGLNARIGFRFGREHFVGRLAKGAIDIARGETAGVDVVFVCGPMVLASLVYGGRTIADAESAGELEVTGDRKLAQKFVTLFVLPPKVQLG